MREGKIVMMPIIIAAILIICCAVAFIFINPQKEDKSVFDYHTVGQILDDGYKRAIDDSFKLTGINECGYSGDAQIDISDDEKIESIWFITNLSRDIQNEDNKIESIVKKFVESYSEKRGFSIINKPVVLQYSDDETFKNRPDDDYKALAEGYVIFEYSYRDAEGILWIAQVFSPNENCLSGLLVKQINEEDFEGYIPQVDMRKEKKK